MRKHTQSTKDLMAERRREWHQKHPGHFKGVRLTDEHIQKISVTHQQRNAIIEEQRMKTSNVHNGRVITRAGMLAATPEEGRRDLLDWIDNEGMNHIPQIRIMRDERDNWRSGLSQALLYRGGLAEMDRQSNFNCYTLRNIVEDCLHNTGFTFKAIEWTQHLGRAMATSDFKYIVSEVAGKFMLEGFEAVPTTFDLWTKAVDVANFRKQTLVGLSEFSNIPRLSESGIVQKATIEDYQETFNLDTYSAIFPITRMSIVNDDVGILTTVPQRLGEAAKNTLNDAVYQKLNANPVMADGQTLFCSQHANVTLPGTLNAAMIDVIRANMAIQKDQNNVRLRMTPNMILCPVELQGTLNSIMNAQYIPNEKGILNQTNPVNGLAEVISDAALDDLNPKAFYAVASRYPSIIVAYLKASNRQPTIQQIKSRLFDGDEYKVTFDFGLCAANHRTLYKGILS